MPPGRAPQPPSRDPTGRARGGSGRGALTQAVPLRPPSPAQGEGPKPRTGAGVRRAAGRARRSPRPAAPLPQGERKQVPRPAGPDPLPCREGHGQTPSFSPAGRGPRPRSPALGATGGPHRSSASPVFPSPSPLSQAPMLKSLTLLTRHSLEGRGRPYANTPADAPHPPSALASLRAHAEEARAAARQDIAPHLPPTHGARRALQGASPPRRKRLREGSVRRCYHTPGVVRN